VGRHCALSLQAAGFRVRATSRDPERARKQFDYLEFTFCDFESESSIVAAMSGCKGAVYLVHGLGTGADYPEREARAALLFQRAAAVTALERIVYLGGVAPTGTASRHLASRLNTGQLLREGTVPTIELRAAMVIGHQSQSFTLVRDLAVNAPVIALPPWLDNCSCPIAICDASAAIAVAMACPYSHSLWFELGGPECLSHRALLEMLCNAFGTGLWERRIARLTPAMAAVGLSALTRVPTEVLRELVAGLDSPLTPNGPSFFTSDMAAELRTVRQAIADAFSDESAEQSPSIETRRRIEEKTTRWLKRLGANRD